MTEQRASDAPHEAWDAADRKDAALKLAAISSYMEQMENFDDAAFLRRLAHSFAVFTPPPSARDALMQAANVIHDRAVLRHGWDKHADAAVIHALAEQMPASAPSSGYTYNYEENASPTAEEYRQQLRDYLDAVHAEEKANATTPV